MIGTLNTVQCIDAAAHMHNMHLIHMLSSYLPKVQHGVIKWRHHEAIVGLAGSQTEVLLHGTTLISYVRIIECDTSAKMIHLWFLRLSTRMRRPLQKQRREPQKQRNQRHWPMRQPQRKQTRYRAKHWRRIQTTIHMDKIPHMATTVIPHQGKARQHCWRSLQAGVRL